MNLLVILLVLLVAAIACFIVAWGFAVPDFLWEGGNPPAWMAGGLALFAASSLPWTR